MPADVLLSLVWEGLVVIGPRWRVLNIVLANNAALQQLGAGDALNKVHCTV